MIIGSMRIVAKMKIVGRRKKRKQGYLKEMPTATSKKTYTDFAAERRFFFHCTLNPGPTSCHGEVYL